MIYGQGVSPSALITTVSQQSTIQVEPKVNTYGFVHLETTAINSYVVINGKEKPILCRADSDPLAVKSLYAL